MSLSKPDNKRRVDFECRTFKTEWSVNYFVTELGNRALCLLCYDTISVLKKYNIHRHYQSKHSTEYSQLTGEQRVEKLEILKQKLLLNRIKKKAATKKDNLFMMEYKRKREAASNNFFSEGNQIKQEVEESENLSNSCENFNIQLESMPIKNENSLDSEDKNNEDEFNDSYTEIYVKTEDLSDVDDCDTMGDNRLVNIPEYSELQNPKQNQCHCGTETRAEAFSKIISAQLKQITNEEIYNTTKWNIQNAIMDGLQKQLTLDKPK